MKTILAVSVLVPAIYLLYYAESDNNIIISSGAFKNVNDSIDFKTQVQPILQAHCSPCHFNGGKMYDKLPFDNPQSILLKPQLVLKRINDEKENALIKKFIEQNQGK